MKIRTLFFVLLIALPANVSSSAVKNSAKKEASKPSPDQILIEKAKDAIRERLKDPESAQFRNIRVGKEDFKPVRGEVNAKNSYGGYIGYQKFYVDFGRDGVVLENECLDLESEAIKLLRLNQSPRDGALYIRLFVTGWEAE
jgi:hypothetical protein